MKKGLIFLVVVALMITMLLPVCHGKQATAPFTKKDTLIVASNEDPKDLNPYRNQGEQSARVSYQIFERLVDQGEKSGTFDPVLATSWEVVDNGLGMVFKLRKGVKFHNGEEMKASDVVFSFKTMKNESNVNAGINWIDWDGVRAIDDYTVKIPFKYKNSLTLSYLSANNMYIVSEKAFKEYGDKIGANPIGTGPFKVTKHVMGDRIEMVRNDNYWGKKPLIKNFTIRFISESSQALIAMETGSVDMILNLSGIDKKHVEEKPKKLKIIQAKAQRCDAVCFNISIPPFDNKLVRQACAYVINQQEIFKATYQSNGRVSHGIISPDIWGYNPEIEKKWPYKVDVAKAKQLMAQAGYPNGVNVELQIDDNAFRITTAEIVKNQLAKIGIIANIKSTDFASWYADLYKGKENLFLQGISTPSGEPDSALFLRFHKSLAVDNGTNMTRYKNDEFSEQLDKARLTFDTNEKLKYYARAQELLMEDLPIIPYYVYPTQFAAVKNLQGIKTLGKAFYAKNAYFN